MTIDARTTTPPTPAVLLDVTSAPCAMPPTLGAQRRGHARRGAASVRILAGLLALVLAAVVLSRLPRHADRELAPQDTLRTLLRELATAQELHAATAGTYALPAALSGFTLPDGVVLEDASADSASWSAALRHEESGVACRAAVGPAETLTPECDAPQGAGPG